MRDSSKKDAQSQRLLGGWEEIANYLGHGVRTVQRYERYLGLPVRRPTEQPRGSVVATKAELDAWVLASPLRKQSFHLKRQRNEAEYEAAATTIKKGIAEMGTLRDQMNALRSDLKTSVRLLRETIHSLHGEMDNRWGYAAPPRVSSSRFRFQN